MIIISITLQYANGTSWFAGTFTGSDQAVAQAAADEWIANEKTRPYWDSATQVNQTVTTIAVPGN